MSTDLERTQLEIARLQLERERRRMRAEEAVGSAARSAAIGTGRVAMAVLRVLGTAVVGAVVGGLGVCTLLAAQALLSDVPSGADAAYRIGYRLGAEEGKIWFVTCFTAIGLPLLQLFSSRRAR